jgi:tetratricopeptide (TPR) repeat protein
MLRPQPLGVFPFPAGLLLLPEADGADSALAGLMRGDSATLLPEEWAFFRLALEGDYDAALAAVKGEDAIARHNRMALGENLQGGDVLFEAARYAVGRTEEVPEPGDLDGELKAFVLMLQATRSIEANELSAAAHHLNEAIDAAKPVSKEFAAQLLGQLAALAAEDRPALALEHYREALEIAQGPAKAELSFQLGITLQDSSHGGRGALVEAVKAYQDALRFGITLERNPESFALIQNNLALAYLAMPMVEAGDQLRMGIAIQSLREALKVYTKETHPDQWASTQLNLANALQYVPTSHPEENLIQAVEIYDEILSVRQKAFDPVGYARVLANQANALAHLGIFAPAMEKVSEAYKLFLWHNEPEMAASAMSLVESISEQKGQPNGLA